MYNVHLRLPLTVSSSAMPGGTEAQKYLQVAPKTAFTPAGAGMTARAIAAESLLSVRDWQGETSALQDCLYASKSLYTLLLTCRSLALPSLKAVPRVS